MTELLFFDTFFHEGVSPEGYNLDLVQFSKPVKITEIRIIPLGSRVEAKFPNGGDRLGATNPTSFDVAFYVNNLAKGGSSTFKSIGKLSYRQNVSIVTKIDVMVPTDGLLIRGQYQTITIAILGEVTSLGSSEQPPSFVSTSEAVANNGETVEVKSDDLPASPSSPIIAEPATSDVGERISVQNYVSRENLSESALSDQIPSGLDNGRDDSKKGSERCPSLDDLSLSSSMTRSSLPSGSPMMFDVEGASSSFCLRDREDSVTRFTNDSLASKMEPPIVDPDLLENVSLEEGSLSIQESGTIDAEAISDDELPPIADEGDDEDMEEALEDINSDDENDVIGSDDKMTDGEDESTSTLEHSVIDDAPNHIVHFDPKRDSLIPLPAQLDPCLVIATIDMDEVTSSIRFLGEYIEDREKFLSTIKQISTIKTLTTSDFKMTADHEDVIDIVVRILHSLLTLQPRGRTVRQTKGTLTLVRILLSGPIDIRLKLLEKGITSRFIKLYDAEFMLPPSLRLRILECVDVLMDFRKGMEFSLLKPHSEGTEETIYQWISTKITSKTPKCSTRVLVGLTALLKKCHFSESLTLLSRLSSKNNAQESKVSEIESCLSQIIHLTKHVVNFMHQPQRLLPTSRIFEQKLDDLVDTTCFKLSDSYRLLESCLNVLRNQNLSTKSHRLVLELVEHISKLREGSLFLLTGNSFSIIREILQISLQRSNQEISSIARSLSFRLFACGLISHLNLQAKNEQIADESMSFEQGVHRLYMFLFSHDAHNALTTSCQDDSIVQSLFQIPTLLKLSDQKIMVDCLFQIIVHVILTRRDVVRMYKVSCSRLSRLLRDHANHSVLAPFSDTMSLIYQVDYTSDEYFARLCRTLRREFDVIKETSTSSTIHLLSIVRVMFEVVMDPRSGQHDDFADPIELKYDFAKSHLYANGAIDQICLLIDHIIAHFNNPYRRMSMTEGSVIISIEILITSVDVIRSILKKVIDLRGIEQFQNVTTIPVLIRILSISELFDNDFESHRMQELETKVKETISLFVRCPPSLTTDKSQEIDRDKSLWIKMLKELFTLTMSSTKWFGAGLKVLDHLLPEPLPIVLPQNQPIPDEKQIEAIMSSRRMCSLHLQHVSEDIESLIATLCCSSDPNIVSKLFKICVKLSDLPVTPSVSCCRGLLITFTLIKDSIAELSNWLNFVNHLLDYPSFRLTFLFCLFHSTKETSFESSFVAILNLLSTFLNEDVTVSIVSFLTKLCDFPKSRLETKVEKTQDELQDFADNLPPIDSLKKIVNQIIGVVKSLWLTDRVTSSIEQLFHVLLSNKLSSSVVKSTWIHSNDPLSLILSTVNPLLEKATSTNETEDFDIESISSMLPRPRLLAIIFDERKVLKVVDPETDLESRYPSISQSDNNFININLKSLTDNVSTSLSILKELESLASDESPTTTKRKIRSTQPPEQQPQEYNSKRLTITPNRTATSTPRGRGRGGATTSRLNDSFRSRPPNTSRPPSMHVDDFVAMEQSGGHQGHQKKKQTQNIRKRGPPLITGNPSPSQQVKQRRHF